MLAPLTPDNEQLRLKNLDSYKILDSIEESSFDDLLTIAAMICNCPTAIISFVGKDRQWFKSRLNFKATEMARSLSFCGHTILKNEVMVVNNANADIRFHDNPGVTGDPNICFYAGSPIVSEAGFRLGAVCVIDDKPRKLSDEQIDCLKNISVQVSSLLELRLQNLHLNKKIERQRFEAGENMNSLFLQNQLPQFIFDSITFEFIEVNESALSFYGYSREEFLKLTPPEIKVFRSNQEMEERILAIKSIEESCTFNCIQRTKHKEEIETEVTISNFLLKGKKYKVFTVAKNLTKERYLERKLKKEKALHHQNVMETVVLKKEKEQTCYALQENVNQILASVKLCLGVAKNNDNLRLDLIKKGIENITIAMQEVKQLHYDLANN